MSVNSNVNKELLLELLNNVIEENGFIINISLLQNFINKQCDTFEKKKHLYKGLSAINKIILDKSYIFILEENLETNEITIVNDDNLFDNNSFDKNVKIAKDNFENMITLKKPEEINFEDDEDEAMPPENLESIMNKTLADRENELKNITQKYSDKNKKEAESWINKDSPRNERLNSDDSNNTNDSNNSNDSDDTSNISINYNSNSDSGYDSNTLKKRVSFEEPLETFNIFNKLKKKSNANQISIDKLETKMDKLTQNQDIILQQQNKILELLLNKTTQDNMNEEVEEDNNDAVEEVNNNGVVDDDNNGKDNSD